MRLGGLILTEIIDRNIVGCKRQTLKNVSFLFVKNRLKIYDYDTIFGQWSKHKGRKLIDVIGSDWDYINWCQEHLDHFIFAEEMMYILKEPNGSFKFSKKALEKRQRNLGLLRQQQDDFEAMEHERFEEMQTKINEEELNNYNPYTEESGDYNNHPNFSTDPYYD